MSTVCVRIALSDAKRQETGALSYWIGNHSLVRAPSDFVSVHSSRLTICLNIVILLKLAQFYKFQLIYSLKLKSKCYSTRKIKNFFTASLISSTVNPLFLCKHFIVCAVLWNTYSFNSKRKIIYACTQKAAKIEQKKSLFFRRYT